MNSKFLKFEITGHRYGMRYFERFEFGLRLVIICYCIDK